jgi:hypothetical protein
MKNGNHFHLKKETGKKENANHLEIIMKIGNLAPRVENQNKVLGENVDNRRMKMSSLIGKERKSMNRNRAASPPGDPSRSRSHAGVEVRSSSGVVNVQSRLNVQIVAEPGL